MTDVTDDLMAIGDFAARSGLSPKRLRSYAASGLLAPAVVDPETGYRYYTSGQIPDARLIDTLRQAGMPLVEIQTLLAEGSRDRLDAWGRRIRADAARKHEALASARDLLCPEHATQARRGAERSPMVRLNVAGRTHVGHVRENNEDAIIADDGLIAVADGMGGHPGGEVASALAAAVVAATFTGRSSDELAAAARAANWVIWERGSSTPELAGMGATLCAMGVIDDATLAIVHVGDSRAYLARGNTLVRLTEDHTVTAELVRDGTLTEVEAARHPQRRFLTRALGVGRDVQIHTAEVTVGPGDRVLLCSDGLFTEVTDAELASLMRPPTTPGLVVDSAIERALANGGHDNVSVVVADVCS